MRILLSALLCLSTTVACDRGTASTDAGFRDLPADQVVIPLDTDVTVLGTLRTRIHADTAYIWQEDERMLLFPVRVRMYDDNGTETAHLVADEGELFAATDRLIARGGVVLITSDGDREIHTEELHYDPEGHRIWSDVHTVLIEGTSHLDGSGFEATEDLREIQVFDGVGENLEIGF